MRRFKKPFTLYPLSFFRSQWSTDNGKGPVKDEELTVNGSRGDTIVEVMAAIAVLGLALGAAYGLSNRAFNTGVHAQDRIEAMALAEGQVEFLRDIGLRGQMGTFNKSGTFCFNDLDGQRLTLGCTNYQSGIYTPNIIYDTSTNVFTIKVRWVSGGGGDLKQLNIYYKPPS